MQKRGKLFASFLANKINKQPNYNEKQLKIAIAICCLDVEKFTAQIRKDTRQKFLSCLFSSFKLKNNMIYIYI